MSKNVHVQDVNNKDNFATLIVDVLDDNDHEPKFMADLIQKVSKVSQKSPKIYFYFPFKT